ncbi:hypothetical protein DPMN_018138 [Dreissena polymorpha]|uniref:Uncharacterized protein n=1 Tax=Dreissena polymorpha TaxID=45954 RepID=A0A9D4S837_DREPO|nr:hypothetical protein DPMN_018138 [Dreissena polymorpha]
MNDRWTTDSWARDDIWTMTVGRGTIDGRPMNDRWTTDGWARDDIWTTNGRPTVGRWTTMGDDGR